jgi:hypothetical protein
MAVRREKMKKILLSLFFVGVICSITLAQEDTTPPVLLDFTIAPVVFDTGEGPVDLEWCATMRDDLSGLLMVNIDIYREDGQVVHGGGGPASGLLEETVCGTSRLEQFSIYADYYVRVGPIDIQRNILFWADPNFLADTEDLCVIGPCKLTNRLSDELPDTDSDGVPDDADNCPEDYNPNQEDLDLDLIGDVCDPFPDDRDNEQAQCEADLTECLENPLYLDEDGDGEADSTDLCPGTASGEDVDANGCSLSQYCSAIDASTTEGRKICERSDWKNDEPLENKGNCEAVKEDMNSLSYLCVPR